MSSLSMRRVDLRGKALSKSGYAALLPRAEMDVDAAVAAIAPILATVAQASESDLLDLCEKFDGVRPSAIRVPESEIHNALSTLEPAIRVALEEAIVRIRKVHSDQVRTDNFTRVVDGGEVTQKWIPVDRVGLYVPGGS